MNLAFAGDLTELLRAEEAVVMGRYIGGRYDPWMQTLIPSGLAINNARGVGPVKTYNEVTPLGQLLWKAWHHVRQEP